MKKTKCYTLLNTQYDDTKMCRETDASNTGACRFGYLTLADSHKYRDEKDSEAECEELCFDDERRW